MQKGFKTEVLKPFKRTQREAEVQVDVGLVAAASATTAAAT